MKNQLKIGVILSYVTMAIQNIIAIVYTPVMLRLLGNICKKMQQNLWW